MLIFELAARFRKELVLTGSAFYETVLALAERVNRKVQVLRLHAQATRELHAVRTLHCDIGRRMVDQFGSSFQGSEVPQRTSMTTVDALIAGAANQVRQSQDRLGRIESRIRELKCEAAHEDLVAIQRDLAVRDAALERTVVARGAPIVGRPLGDLAVPPTTRLAAAFRGPFLLPITPHLILRPDDVVLLIGLRSDLEQILPQFRKARASRTAS
ncbi:MAG TPA: TrkA C-terminal domain-containing protein [Nitrospiraceae bacterium]|nr:TrkA C-terminal domain-containing protein [Nitrospiraceae bacterium]